MKGFSLVESLVVISIITIVVGVFAFVNSTAKSQAVLDKAQANLVSALQEARNRSAAGFGVADNQYGVHIQQDKIVLFENSYSPGEGFETDFPLSISTDQDNLDLIFNRLNAIPNISEDINIILKHSSGLERTVTITKDGRIDY